MKFKRRSTWFWHESTYTYCLYAWHREIRENVLIFVCLATPFSVEVMVFFSFICIVVVWFWTLVFGRVSRSIHHQARKDVAIKEKITVFALRNVHSHTHTHTLNYSNSHFIFARLCSSIFVHFHTIYRILNCSRNFFLPYNYTQSTWNWRPVKISALQLYYTIG